MPSSYSKFKYKDLKNLGISTKIRKLFKDVQIPAVQPSDLLLAILERNQQIRISSEKAKSENIIAPILNELEAINNRSFAIFSGYQFNVDKALGLAGFCDFIFSKDPEAVEIEAPIFCVVESKNENLDDGLAQCIAEMYASLLFNEKNNSKLPHIFGVVTFGLQWKFIQLTDKQAIVDEKVYHILELPQLLGVLNYIVNQ